ncbi:uncharacterized protein A4U43_C07F29920 [Asparagus officinalis]|uniref:Uncharacterized protein n=1 Tax=Asparagus officinalis TaxID=4686 RepID=A0A5P1EHY7_ASPOF|nr:isoflavone 3'-hydroxylase-like [Asparagus officinalis]ONK64787.1 uncharacterized protein A4U43_C07F29920 [Asparagus officinalis]
METFQPAAPLFLFTTILLIILTCFLGTRTRTRPKNLPPTPLSFPILGHLHLIKKPIHHSLSRLSSRYGPILSLRFGSRPVLLISSSSLAEECFSKNDIIFANRPRLLAGKHLGYNYTTLTWASYGQHWRNLRRISAVEIFSSARLNSFTELRREEVKAMVEGLVRDCEEGQGYTMVEMKPRLFELVLNVMMAMVTGKRCCEVEKAKMLREMVEETFEVSGAANLADFFPALRMGEKKLLRLHKKRDAFAQALLDEHRKNNDVDNDRKGQEGGGGREGKKTSVIDAMLSLQRNEPENYAEDIIKGTISTLLAAGTDTSMVTIEWAMSLLLNHPHIISKLRAELDFIVGNHRIVSESDLPSLPYLRCIIDETLRLHPPAPIIPSHESSDDCNVGGFHVPGGTMLLVNAWAIHRDKQRWKDPNSFKPDRFMGGAGREGWMPFGMGRRGCPGEGMAMRVVGLAVGALVQCFEWDTGSKEVDLGEGVGLVVHKSQPLEALCRPRGFLRKALEYA